MANKRVKKKRTKASILQQQYSKEYKKYLARVRNQQKQGVQVQIIKRVKKPTQVSIEKLKKQGAKEIKRKASVVNMVTGVLISPEEYGRKHALEANRVFIRLTPQEQEYARTHNYSTAEELKKILNKGIRVNITTPVLDYEVIIEEWYDSLESFAPSTEHYLRMKTDVLLLNATEHDRALFAYTYSKAPEVFPKDPYMDKPTVDAVFSNVLQKMGIFESSEDFKNFIQMQDVYVEDE